MELSYQQLNSMKTKDSPSFTSEVKTMPLLPRNNLTDQSYLEIKSESLKQLLLKTFPRWSSEWKQEVLLIKKSNKEKNNSSTMKVWKKKLRKLFNQFSETQLRLIKLLFQLTKEKKNHWNTQEFSSISAIWNKLLEQLEELLELLNHSTNKKENMKQFSVILLIFWTKTKDSASLLALKFMNTQTKINLTFSTWKVSVTNKEKVSLLWAMNSEIGFNHKTHNGKL